jgi:hypothetical protein
MPDDDSIDLSGPIALAWEDFLADMDRRYPVSDWPASRLLAHCDALMQSAAGEVEHERYVEAGELRPRARDIDATLSARGEHTFDEAADAVRQDMAQVILGEAPEPRIVSSRHWETRQKIDLVLNDPDANLTRLAEWSHAVRHAMAYWLTDAQRDECGAARPEWDATGELAMVVGEREHYGAEDMLADAGRHGPDIG